MAVVNLNLKPSPRELKQFGFIALAAFALLGGWIAWRRHLLGVDLGETAWTVAYVLWTVGALSAVLSLVFPAGNRPLWVVLMCVAYPIGLVSHLC